MLCCVPKRLADGGPFHDEAPTRLPFIREIELYFEEDAPPPVLLPCTICARTFMPQSLEKHARICERAAARKRKPFDSAKQRIRGTELAEFLPKQDARRHQDERGRAVRSSWKKTHDDFLRAIREARCDADSRKQPSPLISPGAPTRANEKGACPTCNRHFGIKAYDRHVAWCKERITRVPASPATNLAKERLEARMRYRAPALKNRRAATREKYSPGSAGVHRSAKATSSSPALFKPKESVSVSSNCPRDSPTKLKPASVGYLGQVKGSPIPSGPMKSRLADRTTRPAEDHNPLPTSSRRSSHLAISSRRSLHFPVPPLRSRINDPVSVNELAPFSNSSRRQSDRNGTIHQHVENEEARNREACSIRTTQRNIVSARSRGCPRINDVHVNDETLGVTVQPCRTHEDPRQNDQLATWKRISCRKDSLRTSAELESTYGVDRDFSGDYQPLVDREKEIDAFENQGGRTRLATNELAIRVDDDEITTWLDGIRNLNQTYLIKDSEDMERPEISHGERGPIEHSPRVEFYFANNRRNGEICERDKSKFGREAEANDEEIKVAEIEELETNNEDREEEEDSKGNEEVIEIAECETKESKMDSEDEEDGRKASDGEVEISRLKKPNSADRNGTRKANDTMELDVFSVSKRNKEDERVAMGENSASENIQHIEEPLNDDRLTSDEKSFDAKRDLMLHPNGRNSLIFSDSFVGRSRKCDPSANNAVTPRKIINTCRDESASASASTGNAPVTFTYDRSTRNDSTFLNNRGGETDRNSSLPQNSTIFEVNGQHQGEECLDSDHSDGGERVDFAVDLDGDLNSGARKFLVRVTDEYDRRGGDNTAVAVDRARDDRDSRSSIAFKDDAEESRCRRGRIYLDASVRPFPERVLAGTVGSATRREKRPSANSAEMEHRISESMCLLRDSTDSLISSVEFVELASVSRQSEASRAYEREIIKIIRPSKRKRSCRALPDIKDIKESAEARGNFEGSASQSYWQRASKISRSRLISLEPSRRVGHKLAEKNPRVRILPPVPIGSSLISGRKVELPARPAWCNYVRRRPDFNLVLKARTGRCKDYDPFLLAEQQMKDLLADTSDQSVTSSPRVQTRNNNNNNNNNDNLYSLSRSSAFVRYPYRTTPADLDRGSSLIAPPSEFDDLASSFSSDSTETNSIAREIFLKEGPGVSGPARRSSAGRELGRRLIIDKSRALGGDLLTEERRGGVVADLASKVARPPTDHRPSNSTTTTMTMTTRASSAPRTISRDRKISGDARQIASSKLTEGRRSSDQSLNRRNNSGGGGGGGNNNYSSLSGSNLSLSSIISSEMDIRRSNSVFDELMTSFEEDSSFPALRSLLNNESSFDVSSPARGDRQRNGLVSDEELSSPDSYTAKPQDHSKLSNDSAYSSLNRKYSHHGRSANDVAGRLDEQAGFHVGSEASPQTLKMSKFCHECGLRFPESAKFCCECGVRRLAL